MKKHIRIIFAVIVGLLVYLYLNKNLEHTPQIPQIETVLSQHHQVIQDQIATAINEHYTEFGVLEISLCSATEDCYTIIDNDIALIETQGTFFAEKGPQDLYYTIRFVVNATGAIMIENININK